MKRELLSEDEIVSHMKSLEDWKREGREIKMTAEFNDFIRAMGFVNSVALLAERGNHHPDIDIRWNRVTLALSTHSAGGLTEKDFALAAEISALRM